MTYDPLNSYPYMCTGLIKIMTQKIYFLWNCQIIMSYKCWFLNQCAMVAPVKFLAILNYVP